MPIFDYKCPVCNTEFERIVRSSSEEVECPRCETPCEKLVSAAAFHISGEGVYKPGFSK